MVGVAGLRLHSTFLEIALFTIASPLRGHGYGLVFADAIHALSAHLRRFRTVARATALAVPFWQKAGFSVFQASPVEEAMVQRRGIDLGAHCTYLQRIHDKENQPRRSIPGDGPNRLRVSLPVARKLQTGRRKSMEHVTVYTDIIGGFCARR